MDEQNRYPHDPQDSQGETGRPQTPSGHESGAESGPAAGTGPSSADTAQSWFGDYGQQTESTRPIPAYQQQPPPPWAPGYLPPPAPPKTTRGRGLTATVLVGALVLGGAAGVGGAAIYRAATDDGSGTSNTSGPFQATKTSVVQDGTVEKVSQSVLPSVVKVNVSGSQGAGSGSGIILSKDGKILTNNHVVAGAGDNGTITVNFNDGTTKRAKVIGTDPVTDVAVIQAEGASDLTPASLGKSSDLKVGQAVVAIGSPFGLNATVTTGIVSALNRPVSVASEQDSPQQQNPFGDPEQQQQPQQQGQDLSTTYPAIQTDAAINPGNSGGPLVDMSGRVVGINSSIRTASDTSSSQGGSIGLGFSIPIDEVLPIVNQITDKQTPTHARLGVSVTDVSGNSLTQGAQLRSVENGGAADKAGLKDGDVITKVDDQVIDGSESLVATIRGHRPGDSVQITYLRGGKTHTTNADLGSDANTQNS
jgi:putative serine protease PepD